MDNLSIIIQALLEKASTESIKKQIDDLQSYADTKKIHLSLDINNSEFKSFVANLDKISTNMSKALSINADTSGLNKVAVTMNTTNKEMAFMEKRVKETTNAMGQLVKETSKFKQEANAAGDPVLILTKRTEETVSNFEKQRKEQQKALEAQEKLEQERYVRSWMAKIKEVEERNKQAQKNLTDLTNFQQKMLGGDGFKGELDIFAEKQKGRFETATLEKLRSQIEALNVDTPNLQQNIKKLGIQFSSLKQNAAQSGSVMSRTLENAYKFLRFYLVGGILVRFVNTFKDGINVIVDLDSSLTELNKVADVTSAKLKEVTDRAFEMGTTIGRTGKEVIDATSEWVRAGYGIDEAMGLAEQSLLLTNIGDGIDNVKEASSSLIAILKGFKLEAYDASHAVDALNQVSNTFAVDTNNLTEILKRTSGAIGQTGTSFEELLGLATGGFESLRNAESVASGINMISQRLRGMTESGEAVEGLIPKIQEGLNKYTKGAVSIIDKQNGGLHSTYEILEQLSKVYPTLTGEAKAYINELIAGNRQNKVLVAIMENWNNVESATESAMNSLGSAARENEAYLNSIQGKISQFQSTAQKLWYNTIDSSSIKSIVDFGTGVLKVVDAFGLLNTAIITATTALLLFNKNFLAFYNANIASLFSGLSEIIQYKLVASLGMGKAAAIGLAGAINLIAPIAVITGIMLLIKGIKWLSEAHERQAEKVRKLKEEYDDLNRTLKETDEKHIAVEERLKELYALRESNGVTQAEKEELERLENVSEELLRQIEYEKTLRALRKVELEEETLKLASQKTEKINGGYLKTPLQILLKGTDKITVDEKAQESIELIKEYTSAIEELNKAYDNDKDAEKYKKQLDELTKSRKDAIIELDGLVKRLEEENTKLGETEPGKARKESNELIIASAQEIITALGAEDAEIQKLIASLREGKEPSDDLGDSQLKLAEKIREAQQEFWKYGDATKTLTTALREMSKGDLSEATIDKLISSHKELIPYLNNRAKLQEKINDLLEEERQKAQAERTKEASDAFNDITGSLQSLHKIQNELNKSQEISGDITETIIKQHPELIQHLGNREALEKAIAQAIVTQEQVQRQAYTNMLMNSQTYFNEQIKGNQKLWNTIADAYGKDAQNFKSLAEAKDKIDVFLVNAMGARWKSLYGSQAEALRALIRSSSEAAYTHVPGEGKAAEVARKLAANNLSAAKKQLAALEGIAKAVDFTAKGIDFDKINVGKIGGSSSSSKSVKEAYKPIIDAYQQISNELERINALLEENSILTEQAEGSDKIALLQKRIALIKQQENALKRLNVQQEKELQVVKNSLKGMGFNFDSNNNITNYAQRLSKLTGDTAKSAEELIDRFVELSTSAIPDTNNEILRLKNSIKSIGAEIDTYITDTFDQFYNFLFHNIDEEIKKLEESKAKAREVAEAKIAAIQAEIDQLQEKNEAQKIEEERTKRLMNLAKQREKIANIQENKDYLVWNADGTTSLIANPQKLREETEKLMELEEDYYNWEEDLRNQEQIKKLQDQITSLQDELKNQEKGYDDQIKALQTFLEEQKDILSGANDFQIANAKALMEALAGIDSEMYASRLEALNEFVDSYNNLMSNTVSGNSKIPKITPPKPSSTPTPKPSTPSTSTPSPSSSPTPSSGSSSVGKVSEVQGSLKKGDKGASVKLLQQALVGLGYSLPKYGIDGSFGSETLAAVMQFQKDMGLVVDGSVGAKTKAKFKLKGYATGGINDSPGMYELHGTKSQPEAIFNTRQLNSLFKILNGIRVPQFELPSLVRASVSGGASNVYNFSIGLVQTNDAGGFLDNLKNLANKK